MTDREQILAKILEVYGSLIYPSVKLKVDGIKEVDGRVYLTHSGNDTIVSLLPPIKHDNDIRK